MGAAPYRPTASPFALATPVVQWTAMATYRFSVVIEKDADGFFAHCPELQGCYTQGRTYDDALKNIRDAVRLHVEDRLHSGEKIPTPTAVTLTSLEIAV